MRAAFKRGFSRALLRQSVSMRYVRSNMSQFRAARYFASDDGGMTEEERLARKKQLDETFRKLISDFEEDEEGVLDDVETSMASKDEEDFDFNFDGYSEDNSSLSGARGKYDDSDSDAIEYSDLDDTPSADNAIDNDGTLESALNSWRARIGGKRLEDVVNLEATNMGLSTVVGEDPARSDQKSLLAQRIVDNLLDDESLTDIEKTALLHLEGLKTKFPDFNIRPHVQQFAARMSLHQAWFLLDDYNGRVIRRYIRTGDKANALPPVNDSERMQLDAAKLRLEQFGFAYPDNAPPGMSNEGPKAARYRMAQLATLREVNPDQPHMSMGDPYTNASQSTMTQQWAPTPHAKSTTAEQMDDELASGFKKRHCGFCTMGSKWTYDNLTYMNVDLLKRFVSHGGKILPRKFHGTCWKHQRILARSIKRARNAALIPYDGFEMKPKNLFYQWPNEEKHADKVLHQQEAEMKDTTERLARDLGYDTKDLFGVKSEEDEENSGKDFGDEDLSDMHFDEDVFDSESDGEKTKA